MTIFDPARGRVIDGGGGHGAGGLLRLIGLGIAAFLLVILFFSSVTRVGTGHVGVLTLFGKVQEGGTLGEGIHLINPLKTNNELSIQTQTLKESANVPSSEGLMMSLDTSLIYHLNPDRAAEVFQKIGADYENIVVEPTLRSAIREATASHTANALYTGEREMVGIALARLGRYSEAIEQIEISVAQAEANDMPQAACRGYTNLGVLYASLDPQRSIETCLRGLEVAKKVGDLGFQSRLYANLAVAYCALTNRCEAEGIEAARAAAKLDRRLGLLDHLAVPLIVLGQIHQCHGDHARAFASYTEALHLAEQVDDPQLLFPCYDGLATLYLDTGRPTQAESYLTMARAVCERAGLEPDALMMLPFLC